MKSTFFIGFLFVGLGIIIYFTVTSLDAANKQGYQQGYKDACIDFYQGKVKMDLVKNSDGTTEWKWITEQTNNQIGKENNK